jgi:hypothetical protein
VRYFEDELTGIIQLVRISGLGPKRLGTTRLGHDGKVTLPKCAYFFRLALVVALSLGIVTPLSLQGNLTDILKKLLFTCLLARHPKKEQGRLVTTPVRQEIFYLLFI